MKLTVIVPVFNERYDVIRVLESLSDLRLIRRFSKEVIVVDDGSTDGSGDAIQIFMRSTGGDEWKYLTNRRNLGKGAAIQGGIRAATGDYIVIHDSDLEYSAADHNLLLKVALDRPADVVYGARFSCGRVPGTRIANYAANCFLSWIARCITGLPVTDMHTCLKLFDASLLRAIPLQEQRFAFCPEVTAKLGRMCFVRFAEAEVSYFPRSRDEGKKIGLRDGLRALYAIVKYSSIPLSGAAAGWAPARTSDRQVHCERRREGLSNAEHRGPL